MRSIEILQLPYRGAPAAMERTRGDGASSRRREVRSSTGAKSGGRLSTRRETVTYDNLVAMLFEPGVRRQVADELRRALPDSCDALLDGLRHGPPSVRRWCAVVLDHASHDERIEQALVEAASD